MDIEFATANPETALSEYVDSFWMIKNCSDIYKEIVVVPDGRMDLFFPMRQANRFMQCLWAWSAHRRKLYSLHK